MILQPIVEGKGEVQAIREMIFRLMTDAACFDFQVAHPIRRTISQLLNPEQLEIAIRLARNTENVSAIIIVFDGDLDMPRKNNEYSPFCPKDDAAPLAQVAKSVAHEIPCELVVALKEYESWLLAGIEGIRGQCGIPVNAVCPLNHDVVRDAKGALSDLMPSGSPYSPIAHQTALTNRFDLGLAHQRSRSFRKMAKAFKDLHSAVGISLDDWPPAAWDASTPQ